MRDQFEDLKELLGENHVEEVAELSAMLQDYHAVREQEYDRSFAKRGLVGIWCNLGRKHDAIDNQGTRGKLVSVIVIDHLVDLALYALKFVVTLRKLSPATWETWYQDVYLKALNDKSE